jgi:hypothetical protein
MIIISELSPRVILGGPYIYVSRGSAALAFKIKCEGDWRSRFVFYDELTPEERAIIERCIIEQGGSLRESGWYFADEDVKTIAQQEHVRQYIRNMLCHLEIANRFYTEQIYRLKGNYEQDKRKW